MLLWYGGAGFQYLTIRVLTYPTAKNKRKNTTTIKTWRGWCDEDDGKEKKMIDTDNIDKDDVADLTQHGSAGQGATSVGGAPGWLAPNPVRGVREPHLGSMQL